MFGLLKVNEHRDLEKKQYIEKCDNNYTKIQLNMII